MTTTPARVTLGPRTEDVLIAAVPMEFFGNTARPIMGRTFAPEDFGGPAAVCILSYPLWERFGAGTSDAPLVLGDARLQVVGVMPEDFHIPAGANVWIPLIPAPP